MKVLLIALFISSAFALALALNFELISNLLTGQKALATKGPTSLSKGSLYDFDMRALNGETISLKKYEGKKVVIINVASECGFTPQYEVWQDFHKNYGDKIVVLGFPANNFGGQEPGADEEIASFCKTNYGVTFQMFSKIDVIGQNQHQLYQWLSHKDLNGWNDKAPSWNFCKYLVNEKGELTHFFASKTTPDNDEFKKAVGI